MDSFKQLEVPAAEGPIYERLQRNEVELSLATWKKTSGTPLLLIHGGAHTRHTFDRVVEGLADTGPLIAYDVRGHGESGWHQDEIYYLHVFSDDIAAVLREKTNTPAVIAGSSMSGLHCLTVAAEHPDLVKGLVMIDLLPKIEKGTLRNLRKFFTDLPFKSYEDLLQLYYEDISKGRETADCIRELSFSTGEKPDGTYGFTFDKRTIDFITILHMEAFYENARKVTWPILLLTGTEKPMVTPDAIDEFLKNIPNCKDFQIRPIKGGSHCPWQQNPQAFVEEISSFKQRLEKLD